MKWNGDKQIKCFQQGLEINVSNNKPIPTYYIVQVNCTKLLNYNVFKLNVIKLYSDGVN